MKSGKNWATKQEWKLEEMILSWALGRLDLLFGRGKHFLTTFQSLTWTVLLDLLLYHHHLLADKAGLRFTPLCLAVTLKCEQQVWPNRVSRLEENQSNSRKAFYQYTVYFIPTNPRQWEFQSTNGEVLLAVTASTLPTSQLKHSTPHVSLWQERDYLCGN